MAEVHQSSLNVNNNSMATLKEQTNQQHNIEEDWKTLATQVGGHSFDQGDKHGMVDLCNGLVLKSLQNPPRGLRELTFYQKVFDPDTIDDDLVELREFMPTFHGTLEKNGVKFLKLDNLTRGFKNPCVIDLKMGKVTYDQEATPEKIAGEIAKYPPLTKLGFQITGMMVYDPIKDTFEKFDKSYGKSLTEDTIVTEGLKKYFWQGKGEVRTDAVQPILSKLLKLELWFLKQKKYSFIASSLFMVYEGSKVIDRIIASDNKHNKIISVDKVKDNKGEDGEVKEYGSPYHKRQIVDNNVEHTCSKKAKLLQSPLELKADLLDLVNSQKLAQVHLIDFAHAFPAKDTDHNFLFGLQKLISILKTFV